ncbi:hypothetical protein QX233_15905 [Chryseobacterium gambrini]|uniref:Uncharacterized protein n=2 Tax=Chryseobacterium TaxID=59732 RepID=A0AAJ1R9H6_9FLAO|nr:MULTISPECIES: hypothetical protein [Chryseobacterium]MDN4013958.1 hypothetical protein [Chryseobacterium gambrini]MDN4031570.1 hypothetical protein [Chryseobacterium gambrini]QWA38360.1 hypothetical protein KKI44_21205 [Chryseobacterium sp. ZHDP1]
MNSFYKSIGLYDELIFETTMDKAEFMYILKKLIYHSNFSFFENSEYLIPKRYEYKGYLNKNEFLIMRRRHLFDMSSPNPYIRGTINDENGKTFIRMEFTPIKYSGISLIFPIIFLIIFFNIPFQGSSDMSFIVIIPIIGVINYYFTLKRNITRGKYDFERELNFIVQKNNMLKNTR